MKAVPEDIQELLQILESAAQRRDETGSRVRLPNGQLARLSSELDADYGYRKAELSLKTPRVEKAIVAALTAINGEQVDPKRVRRAIYSSELSQEALRSRVTGGSSPEPPPETDRIIKNATAGDVRVGFRLSYVQDLLRHYRPDFDSMSKEEQIALTTRVVEHANVFLEALRKLSACLQYGDPYEGLPNTPVKKAARDVRAAELRDIHELTNKEIGARLGVDPYKKDADRNDNTPVRTRCVPNGREILKRALGVEDDGYWEYVEARKAEAQRWSSLPESWRWAELFAQGTEIPTEKLHRIMTCSDEDMADALSGLDDELSGLNEDQISSLAYARSAWEFYGEKGESEAGHA